MSRAAHYVLPLLFVASVSACAQNSGAASAAATQAAAPAATTTAMPTDTMPPKANGVPAGTITGVPKYRAGRRGPRGTAAPVATSKVVDTGAKNAAANGNDSSSILSSAAVMGPNDVDSSTLAIPQFQNAFGVPSGAMIRVKINRPIDSGTAHNGDNIDGTLVAPLGSAPAGSPVKLTVVAAAKAGSMSSRGELSLQVISINGQTVLSRVVTAEGQEGKKLTADSAPERGTEASFTPDKPLELPVS